MTLRSIGKPGLNYGHFVIDARAYSSATVVMDHLGEATVAANVEVLVGDGASLTLVSVQDWDAEAVHVAAHAARLGRDARYTHIAVNLGGAVVRLNPTVHLRRAGGGRPSCTGCPSPARASTRSRGSTSTTRCRSAARRWSTSRCWTARRRARCGSATSGSGRRRVATTTYELNRNLLLTDGARADSVPNLEIETGEIAGAGHASATGRFDDLQLFYLQSRGIPEDEARRLVVRGFLADVIGRIDGAASCTTG